MKGLRAALLSGGASRRMGTDKALLPHPAGGTWLDVTLERLAALPVPITLLSRHPAHLDLAGRHRDGLGQPIEALVEPPPWEGPLLALHRLMERHPDLVLLLAPVDMPWLEVASLEALVAATATEAEAIHLAHDGQRLQPLLGVYPAHVRHRRSMGAFTAAGGRRLQDWLAGETVRPVPLPPCGLRNANRPDTAAGLFP